MLDKMILTAVAVSAYGAGYVHRKSKRKKKKMHAANLIQTQWRKHEQQQSAARTIQTHKAARNAVIMAYGAAAQVLASAAIASARCAMIPHGESEYSDFSDASESDASDESNRGHMLLNMALC